jgi:hypothetical protein
LEGFSFWEFDLVFPGGLFAGSFATGSGVISLGIALGVTGCSLTLVSAGTDGVSLAIGVGRGLIVGELVSRFSNTVLGNSMLSLPIHTISPENKTNRKLTIKLQNNKDCEDDLPIDFGAINN